MNASHFDLATDRRHQEHLVLFGQLFHNSQRTCDDLLYKILIRVIQVFEHVLQVVFSQLLKVGDCVFAVVGDQVQVEARAVQLLAVFQETLDLFVGLH